jgi:hypothetical protein
MTQTIHDAQMDAYTQEWTEPRGAGMLTTHDLQQQGCIVPFGYEAKPGKEAVAAHNRKRAEDARRARAERAAPTGPRSDEKEGWVPDGTTTGAVNPEARGPIVEWKPPVGGKWVAGLNGVERFVPDPAPVLTPVPKAPPAAVPVHVEVKGTLTGTSAIGAIAKNEHAALPCGPAPISWTDPTAKQ